jgi:hypothetical protein
MEASRLSLWTMAIAPRAQTAWMNRHAHLSNSPSSEGQKTATALETALDARRQRIITSESRVLKTDKHKRIIPAGFNHRERAIPRAR